MSIESDSSDCLIDAIAADNNAVLTPEQLNGLTPADEGFQHSSESWRRVLARAILCLKEKGYQIVREPTRPEAAELLDKPFSDSVILLTECVDGPLGLRGAAGAAALVATGAVLGAAATVAVQAAARPSRKRDADT